MLVPDDDVFRDFGNVTTGESKMGITWCRERMEQAQNSKSPVDRILVRCSNAIKPKTTYSHSQGKIANDFVYKGMRAKSLEISHPVPIHAVPPRTRHRNQKSSDWQTCTLTVPDSEDLSEPPIPPPRKKRRRKINSVEVLNSQLPELHSPSYVIYSENLINRHLADSKEAELNETDTLHPLEESFSKEKAWGHDCFGKLSGNRRRKIKTESHPNDVKEEKVKNDNERKPEQKIKLASTISSPNYNELVKPSRKVSTDAENGDDKTGNQSAGLKHPRRNPSTISLPGEGSNSILGSLSEATIHRLEAYMKRCRSFGSLKPQQILEKLEEFNKTNRSASESSDSWSGLDDWDLGVIEYCDSETTQVPPLTPKSTLPPKRGRVSFYESHSYFDQNQENTHNENENSSDQQKESEADQEPQIEEGPTGKTPILIRTESIIEGVPLEWFLDPQLRPPAIMPPPPSGSEPKAQEYVKTPPPSPEGEAISQKDSEPEEHSSLLNILREYKEDEYDEPEVRIDVGEILGPAEEVPEKVSLNFEELDVDAPQNLNPFLPVKSRSSSLTEEQIRLLYAEKSKFRSPSIGFERSTLLLEQLQKNKETIEKEIVLKPNELITGLRRVSLCRSLPEDAFEVFVNKKKPSLRESLNEFLGFKDGTKPNRADNENTEKVSNEEELNAKSHDKKDDDEEEKLPAPTAPPLPLDPPPIVIDPPPAEENTSSPQSLVKPNDNKDLM